MGPEQYSAEMEKIAAEEAAKKEKSDDDTDDPVKKHPAGVKIPTGGVTIYPDQLRSSRESIQSSEFWEKIQEENRKFLDEMYKLSKGNSLEGDEPRKREEIIKRHKELNEELIKTMKELSEKSRIGKPKEKKRDTPGS